MNLSHSTFSSIVSENQVKVYLLSVQSILIVVVTICLLLRHCATLHVAQVSLELLTLLLSFKCSN